MKTPVNADCDYLNRSFGAQGRIVFRPSKQGTPIVVLANQYGTAEVALWGGTVFSYRPTGNQPVLFMPGNYDDFEAGSEIHGGIPVCWPWFGRCGEKGSRMHGLVRFMPWYVKSSEYSEDISEITLGFKSNEETKKIWNYDFELSLKISVSMKLTLELTATNTDDKPFWVTEGYHPYLRVRDIDQVTLKGIDGCEFFDDEDPEKGDKRIWVGDMPIEPGCKVFKTEKLEWALIDEGLNRAIAMVSRGNKKLIMWNPGDRPFAGLNDGDYKKFVCIEPSTLFREAGYELKPGESHDLKMAIQSVPNDGSVHACR